MNPGIRDERNEYFGITLERAIRLLDALNVKLRTQVEIVATGKQQSPDRSTSLTG